MLYLVYLIHKNLKCKMSRFGFKGVMCWTISWQGSDKTQGSHCTRPRNNPVHHIFYTFIFVCIKQTGYKMLIREISSHFAKITWPTAGCRFTFNVHLWECYQSSLDRETRNLRSYIYKIKIPLKVYTQSPKDRRVNVYKLQNKKSKVTACSW